MSNTLSKKVLTIEAENAKLIREINLLKTEHKSELNQLRTEYRAEINILRAEVLQLRDLFVKCIKSESTNETTQPVDTKSNNKIEFDLNSYKDNADFKLYMYVDDMLKAQGITCKIPPLSVMEKFFKVIHIYNSNSIKDIEDLVKYCNKFKVEVSKPTIRRYFISEFNVYEMYPKYTETLKQVLRDPEYKDELNAKLSELNIDVKNF